MATIWNKEQVWVDDPWVYVIIEEHEFNRSEKHFIIQMTRLLKVSKFFFCFCSIHVTIEILNKSLSEFSCIELICAVWKVTLIQMIMKQQSEFSMICCTYQRCHSFEKLLLVYIFSCINGTDPHAHEVCFALQKCYMLCQSIFIIDLKWPQFCDCWFFLIRSGVCEFLKQGLIFWLFQKVWNSASKLSVIIKIPLVVNISIKCISIKYDLVNDWFLLDLILDNQVILDCRVLSKFVEILVFLWNPVSWKFFEPIINCSLDTYQLSHIG